MVSKIDMTGHSPAATTQPTRSHTDSILIHHLGIDANKDGIFTFEDAVAFFTLDPEGLATILLPGSYDSKVPTIRAWQRDGLPATVQGRGFVPYHFLVDSTGRAARMLPIEARGAHAGAWNDRSVAIAFLGDFSKAPPSTEEFDTGVALARDIRSVYAATALFAHDETLIMQGIPPKGCPGPGFPLDHFRAAVREAPQS